MIFGGVFNGNSDKINPSVRQSVSIFILESSKMPRLSAWAAQLR